ncbi:hypothetical protein HYALB_00011770 [Hymenoscyphus albidus]|uniref:Uncharacterized protein n=1 Tax=Hymenoscyphus albidus TaxID=595503 RepID=A0A9N9LNH6_9HELO|nr:hypothetical protein HYALB_00011770 [Hymenoscyphus albidus]
MNLDFRMKAANSCELSEGGSDTVSDENLDSVAYKTKTEMKIKPDSQKPKLSVFKTLREAQSKGDKNDTASSSEISLPDEEDNASKVVQIPR